jgi:hypothetical protein
MRDFFLRKAESKGRSKEFGGRRIGDQKYSNKLHFFSARFVWNTGRKKKQGAKT